jgi:hypothetical protein
LGDLGKATAGYDLKVRIRIELSGDPSDGVVEEVNEVLREASEKLRLR